MLGGWISILYTQTVLLSDWLIGINSSWGVPKWKFYQISKLAAGTKRFSFKTNLADIFKKTKLDVYENRKQI